MDPKNLLAELKRRNLYKVAAVYAIVGWLLIQIAAASPWPTPVSVKWNRP